MSEGIWLDRIPYEPASVGCVQCGHPTLHAMCAVVVGEPVAPLCPPCYDSLT